MSKKGLLQILASHADGHAMERGDELLTEVARAVVRHGGTGVVMIALTVKPNGERQGAIEIGVKVTGKKPEGNLGAAFLWVNEDGVTAQPQRDLYDEMLDTGGRVRHLKGARDD